MSELKRLLEEGGLKSGNNLPSLGETDNHGLENEIQKLR
jgi:hypothetical protein